MTAWRRVPLWLRLVTSLLLLAALALTLSGMAGLRLLRGYLVDRVDDQLRAAARSVATTEGIPELSLSVPNPYYFGVFDPNGQPLAQSYLLPEGQQPPERLDLTLQEAHDRKRRGFTTDASEGDGNWRAIAFPLRDVNGTDVGTMVVATSLDNVDATVAHLRRIDILVGMAVLGGLALAAYGTIRSALRPLVEIEQTAGAIAAGDLTRRAPDADPATEVGRLSLAFNAMLDQIETAFRDRAASEATARGSEARMRQFVGDASHELRTPLTSIRGFSELYRQGGITDRAELDDVLRRIEDEATRMGLLVDDLLMLARLDQERPLADEPVDLGGVVREAVATARVMAPERSISLDEGPDPDGCVVRGDATRLRQVVTNLVDNALRHTPDGTPVEVTLQRLDRDGRTWAEVVVQDHGPGLSPEQADRVFERFYRADAARTRTSGGAGLGLSIVATVVAAHGGIAEVEGNPGEGARFRILLPLAPGDSGDSGNAPSS